MRRFALIVALCFFCAGCDSSPDNVAAATIQPRPSDSLPSNEQAIALVKAQPCGNKQVGKKTVGECLEVGVKAGNFNDLGWTVERRYRELLVINKRRYVHKTDIRGNPLIEVNEWAIDSTKIYTRSASAGHITANPLGNPYK